MEHMRKSLVLAGLMLAAVQTGTLAEEPDWPSLQGTNTGHIQYKMPASGQPKGIVILLSGCGGFDGEGLPKLETVDGAPPPDNFEKTQKAFVSAHYDRVADNLNKAGFIAVRYDYVNMITEQGNLTPTCINIKPLAKDYKKDFKNSIANALGAHIPDLKALAPDRDVHVIGWSLGARGVLEAVTNPDHGLLNSFASVTLYSPSCASPPKELTALSAIRLQTLPASRAFRFLLIYGSSDDVPSVAIEGEGADLALGTCQSFLLRSQAPVCEQLGSVETAPVDQVEQMHRSQPTGSLTSSLPSPVRCAVAEGAEHSFDVGSAGEGVHFKADGYVSKYDLAAAEAAWALVKANIGIDQ